MQGIYKITNKTTGKYYIGSAKNIEDRWYIHLWALKQNRHENSKLQRAWNKYGEQDFSFEIVEEFNGTYQELLLLEDTYLCKLPSDAFNLRKSSFKKDPFDQEVRKKISEGVKQHWKENRESHAASLKRFRQDSTYKNQMKESCTIAWDSPERKQKASEIKKGKLNPSADQTIYIFTHKDGSSFVGLRCEFHRLHPELNDTGLKKILTGNWKHYKGWSVKPQSC